MASRRPSEVPVQRISPNEAEAALRSGEAVAVDVRSPEAYAAGHLPGALSLPIARLRAELDRLPRDRSIIFYWTWHNEHSSARAAQIATAFGYRASALLGGLDAWSAIGGPVAVGATDPGD